MNPCTLYAYVLNGEAEVDPLFVVRRVNDFISSRHWKCTAPWAVNQISATEDRDLGLNLLLPEVNQEPTDWFKDVEAIIAFCVQLRTETRHDMIIGIAKNGQAEDIAEIEDNSPDVQYIKKFIGVTSPNASDA